MSNSLLEFYKSQKFNDFVIAVIEKKYNLDELKEQMVIEKECGGNWEVYNDEITMCEGKINDAITAFEAENGKLEPEVKAQFLKTLKASFVFPESSVTICIKQQDGYFDITTDCPVDLEKVDLENIEPLSNYCNEEDVSFEVINGHVGLVVVNFKAVIDAYIKKNNLE